MKTLRLLLILLVCVSFITGCAGMTSGQQRVLSGTAIGAGTGAALGAITGHSVATGAAIGAAAGAVGGLIVDQSKKRRK